MLLFRLYLVLQCPNLSCIVPLCFSVCTKQQTPATGHHQCGKGSPRNDRLGALKGWPCSLLHKQQHLHQDCCGPGSGCRPAHIQRSISVHWYAETYSVHCLVLLFAISAFPVVQSSIVYYQCTWQWAKNKATLASKKVSKTDVRLSLKILGRSTKCSKPGPNLLSSPRLRSPASQAYSQWNSTPRR